MKRLVDHIQFFFDSFLERILVRGVFRTQILKSNIEDGAVEASKAFKRQLFLLKALSYMFDRVPNTSLLLVAPLNQHYLMLTHFSPISHFYTP